MAETRKRYIFWAFVLSAIGTILIIVSLATDSWITAEMREPSDPEPSSVRYGLYYGEIMLRPLATPSYHDLYMVCVLSSSACAVSCKTTAEARELEVQYLAAGLRPLTVECDENIGFNITSPILGDRPVISSGIYIALNLFVYLYFVLSACATFLAILNVRRNPTEPLLGLPGVELSSGIGAVTGSIVLMLWGIYYATSGLKHHLALSYIATQQLEMSVAIGYSYWILLPAVACSISSLVLIELRKYLLEKDPPAPTIQIENHSDGTIFLY